MALGIVQTCLAAAAFFLCGAISASFGPPGYALPLPFAGLFAVLFVRRWRDLLAVMTVIASAYVAGFACVASVGLTVAVGTRIPWALRGFYAAPLVLAGAVGGLGVCVPAGIAESRLRSAPFLIFGSILGALAGLALEPWTIEYAHQQSLAAAKPDPYQAHRLLTGLTMWQGALGSFLAIARQYVKRPRG